MKYFANKILMIKPKLFCYNEETALTNQFQKKILLRDEEVVNKAISEFTDMVALLRENGIDVIQVDDTLKPAKPDAIFPNNWISVSNGFIVIYPMCTENRRYERRQSIINMIKNIREEYQIYDLSFVEKDNTYLEGTGSLVFDHENRYIFACISMRTEKVLVEKIADKFNYTSIVFEALDSNGLPIYHTNVLLSVGKNYLLVCMEAIKDKMKKKKLTDYARETQKKLIEISYSQMYKFCGNIITLSTPEKYLTIVSNTAFLSFDSYQLKILQSDSQIIVPKIPTIESVGGGSVRCMICEII